MLAVVSDKKVPVEGEGECGSLYHPEDLVCHAEVPNSPSLETLGSADFAVEFWFYSDRPEIVSVDYLFTKANNNEGINFILYNAPIFGNSRTFFFINNTDHTFFFNDTMWDAWHHIAISRQSNQLKVYVDGMLNYSALDNSDFSNDEILTIADPGNISANKYYIDEVRVWNTARSESEIVQYMTKPLTGNESGLIAYYNMNEGTGTIMNDLTSNNNHGTLFNGIGWDTKAPFCAGQLLAYAPDIKSTQDYYAFGSLMPGRSFNATESRFGFNGMEQDPEVYGTVGTNYTADYWAYDARTGRRWNPEPVVKPWESVYVYLSGKSNLL